MKPSNSASAPRFRPILLVATILSLGIGSTAWAGAVRFLPLGEEVVDRKIGLQEGGKLTTLEDLNTRKRSKSYSCTFGDTPLSLLALDRERPNGKAMGVEILLPKTMKSPLVLILADPDEPSGMRAIVVEDDEKAFPWGSLRFVNTTGKAYMLRYEKETTPVTEELTPVDISVTGEARNMGVQLYAEDEPQAILYSAVWEHDPNLRKLVIIMPGADPTQKRLKLEIIPQDQRVKD